MTLDSFLGQGVAGVHIFLLQNSALVLGDVYLRRTFVVAAASMRKHLHKHEETHTHHYNQAMLGCRAKTLT